MQTHLCYAMSDYYVSSRFSEPEECSGSSEGAEGGREERGVYAAPWWCGNWILLSENDDHWTRIPPGIDLFIYLPG